MSSQCPVAVTPPPCNGRDVIVTVAHIGVEPDVIQERMRRPDVLATAEGIRSQFPGMKIIVGIDNTEVRRVCLCRGGGEGCL